MSLHRIVLKGIAAEGRSLKRDAFIGGLLTKTRAEIEAEIDAMVIPGNVPATLDALLNLNKALAASVVYLLKRGSM